MWQLARASKSRKRGGADSVLSSPGSTDPRDQPKSPGTDTELEVRATQRALLHHVIAFDVFLLPTRFLLFSPCIAQVPVLVPVPVPVLSSSPLPLLPVSTFRSLFWVVFRGRTVGESRIGVWDPVFLCLVCGKPRSIFVFVPIIVDKFGEREGGGAIHCSAESRLLTTYDVHSRVFPRLAVQRLTP